MTVRRPVWLLAAAALALTACSGGDSPTDAGSVGESEHSTAEHHGDSSGDSSEPVGLPDEFPAEVPIPAGLELESAEMLQGERNRLFDVTGWHAADPVLTGTAFLAELEQLGYEVTSRTDADTSVFFIAEGDDWLVSAGFFSDPVRLEGTSVGITVSPRAG